MPLSVTTDPHTLRVSFSVQGESKDSNHETEIICFLRINDAGLDITYSHHIIRVRESTVGQFTNETPRRMSLTPALTAVIQQGVYYEFWSHFNRIVRTSPAPIGKLPTDVETRMAGEPYRG